MTALTTRRLNACIPVIGWRRHLDFRPIVATLAIGWAPVHLCAAVAVQAAHAALSKVNVCPEVFILPQVLVSDSAPVTCSAIAGHGGLSIEEMPADEASFDGIRLADVAVSAGRMAAGAVIAKHLVQSWIIAGYAASLQHRPVTSKRIVQAVLSVGDDVWMAISASSLRFSAWVTNYTRVGSLFIGCLDSAMAFDTVNPAMDSLRECLTVDQDLLPWLQRSHFAPSTHTCTFFDNLFLEPGCIDQTLFVRMALEAVIGFGVCEIL